MLTDIEYYAANHNLDSYKFSITGKDAEALKVLKKEIREHNKRVREATRRAGKFTTQYTQWSGWKQEVPVGGRLLRVKLQGRGPRAIHSRADFGPNRPRNYDCSLPHRYATHFDVYVYEDHSEEAWLRKEIETGLSRGELNKQATQERNAWWTKLYTEGRIDQEYFLKMLRKI